jgi:O-antigen/teichoic acid export membrane protein
LRKITQRQRDLLSTLITNLWHLFSGPLTLVLISLFLTQEQQGYWYLFGSLSALTILADLGFSNIILQFSAHEYAFLYTENNGLLDGNPANLKKLGSFFRFVKKWLICICGIAFPVVYIAGVFFFVRGGVFFVYILPWSIYVIGSLVNFFTKSILSFIEGLDKIDIVQSIRFRVAIINTCVLVVLLVFHCGIYALAIGMLLSSFSMVFFLFVKFNKIIKQLFHVSSGFKYGWRHEIFPLFFRYALSFASGYLIFQIYTPLMHYFHGPVYGGKVGISLTLVMAIFNLSNIWMYTIIPKINMLVSQKKWNELDSLFRKRLMCVVCTYILVVIGIIFFVVIFGNFWIIPRIISRFLPLASLVILGLCYFIQLFINAWALYLRSHKKEPYVVPSMIAAGWILITTLFIGKFLSIDNFFLGFLSSYIVVIPIFYFIYKKLKTVWHITGYV